MGSIRAISLCLAWAALTAFGLSRLSFNVDVLDLLPADQPEFDGIRDLYRHFGRENELVLTVSAADAAVAQSAAASLAERLSARDDLARSVVWHLPFEENPALAAELLAWFWLNGPPAAVGPLADRLAADRLPETLEAVLEDLTSGFLGENTLLRSYDPLGFTDLPGGLRESVGVDADLFASADGTYRVVFLEAPVASFADYQEVAAWIDSVRVEIADWRADFSDPVAIGITGEPAFVAEISLAMERDMRGSVVATTLLIAALFWLWHRRLAPLFWLMLMLGLVFSATFAIGGALFGTLTAMSIGFAAILLGLAVDYGIILYRESGAARGDPATLRRVIGPSVFWAAATTAAVFASLNFSSLPGIADLGTLVAIGTMVGAAVMLGLFAPIAARAPLIEKAVPVSRPVGSGRAAHVITAAVLIAGLVTWIAAGPPGLNRDARPFQLRDSAAAAAYAEMAQRLGGDEPGHLPHLPVVITADTPQALADRLAEAEVRLQSATEAGWIRNFQLPRALAPDSRNQDANREPLARLAADAGRLEGAILEAGFSEEATALTRQVLAAWTDFAKSPGETTLPRGVFARWLLGRAVSLPAGGDTGACAAVGRLLPATLETDAAGHLAWAGEVNAPGIQITGWDILNPALQSLVAGDFRRVFIPMVGILALMLLIVFRNLRDTLLAIGALAFSGLALMTLTRWLPIEWNTFNASSLPILFGTGLDYGIHMIFALRRENGDLGAIRAGIRKALLFCGLSTAAGFGSLAFAASEGLSSLGIVCALGILLNMATAVWLLPRWWQSWAGAARK
jgi:predicted RND superfamily exporter protein